jgi:hypothetical protein
MRPYLRARRPLYLQLRLLDHVVWIDARAQFRIQAQSNDLVQKRPIAGEKLLKRPLIAGMSLTEQAIRLRRVRGNLVHLMSSPLLPRKAEKM